MKLNVLCKIYPDESVYSWFGRLYLRSGFSKVQDFIKVVYGNKRTYPSMFFIGSLSNEFIDFIDPIIKYKELLLDHTLFKYYARFLDLNRKKDIYKKALGNCNDVETLMPIEQNKNNYYLRYCPKCVQEDRQKYGECYFHIDHAFPKIHICAKHRCRLIDTKISGINPKAKKFFCLEEVVDSLATEEIKKNSIEYKITKYIVDLFKSNLNFKDIRIGDYLTSKLDSKYIKKNYGHRNNALMVRDLKKYYEEISDYNMTEAKLQNILLNKTWNPYELSLVALFENIEPKDLVSYKKYVRVDKVIEGVDWVKLDNDYTEQFIKIASTFSEIDKLQLNKKWLCDKFDLSYMILVDHFHKLIKCMSKIKGKKRNWEMLDVEYCEKLDKLYKDKKELFIGRILTFEYIGSLLGVKDKTLRRFPKLMMKARIIEANHTIKNNKWINAFIKTNAKLNEGFKKGWSGLI